MFIIFVSAGSRVHAATYTVTNTDHIGEGSLREAVGQANNTADADTIVFDIPSTSCVAGLCTINLEYGIEVTNNGSLTIAGSGANRLSISGGGGGRIFYVDGAIFTLTGLTLTNGDGTGGVTTGGGAIYVNGGTLVLRGVDITHNSATFGGKGGGIYFNGGINHQIISSNISNNIAVSGCGGFANEGGTITLTNTTISGNDTRYGGGFCNSGTLTLRNSTIAGNTSSSGTGGIYCGGGTLNIGNSIVAGNTSDPNGDIFLDGGTLTTAGYNLIGDNSSVGTQFPAGNPNTNKDIVGTSSAPINPLLDPLGYYGGRTPTRRLQATSPAIDKGSAVTGVFADARGVIRPLDNPSIPNAVGGNGADIGAFELQTSRRSSFKRHLDY